MSASVLGTVEQRKSGNRSALLLHGGIWSIGGYVSTQVLRTFATLFLARHYLGPEAFGIVGLVTVFISGLTMFSELGIASAIVRHPRGDDDHFLNTALTIQAGRGVAIWLFSLLAAYPLSVFYNRPELLPLISVAAFSEVIRGLSNTAAFTLNRDLRLRNITFLTVGSELFAFAVCIVWALKAPSVWALVARMLAGAVAYALGSQLVIGRRVRFGWERQAAKDLLAFGGWMSLSTAAHFLGSQGERLVIGKLVTPAELGCFSMALMISSVPATGISQVVNQIFLPLISKAIRSSHSDALREFATARRIFLAIAVVASIGFLLVAKPLVGFALNAKYAMAGWMLQVLGLRVALDLFAAPASSMILASGNSQYAAAANTTRTVLLVIGMWLAFSLFGIREAIFSLIVAQAVSYIPIIFGFTRILPEAVHMEIKLYGVLLIVLAIVAVFVWSGV